MAHQEPTVGCGWLVLEIGDEAAKQAVDQVNAYQIPADDLIGLLFVYAGTGAAIGLALPFAAPLLVGGGGVTTFRCLMRSALEGAVAGGIYGAGEYMAGWADGQHAFTFVDFLGATAKGAAGGAFFGAGAKFLPRLGLLFTGSLIVSAAQDLADGNYWNAGWKAIGSVAAGALAKRFLSRACFVAGTKLWTKDGYRAIESLKAHDLVWSRAEDEPKGKLRLRRVLQTYRRSAQILNLHVAGQVIGTTGEHPFYEWSRGWIPAGELRPGDHIASEAGRWLLVEEVFDTGEHTTVYNVEVEGDHTYFVGDETWGFGVWSHNYDMHHGTPKEIIRKAPRHISKPAIRGHRGRPNRVKVDTPEHRSAHAGGHNGGAPRYNEEFLRRLGHLQAIRPLRIQDYWDVRDAMLWEYFGI